MSQSKLPMTGVQMRKSLKDEASPPRLVERRHRRVVVLDGVLHVVRRVLPVHQAPRRTQRRRVRRARRRRAVLLLRLRVRDRRWRGRGRVVAVAAGT